ncbi:MAG: hypothetical protein Q8O34_08370 [Rhodocyclaceae bacterium]|nr:hypothetical protein [Rhodocyclaceae bacterium]
MRIFLFILALAGLSFAAQADELPARQGLRALRGPVAAIVTEAAKGEAADMAEMTRAYQQAGVAWQQVTAKPLDLDQYGIPADQQAEVWRQVRMMGMLMGYMDEATKRSNRGLMLQSAGLLAPAYEKLSAFLDSIRVPVSPGLQFPKGAGSR